MKRIVKFDLTDAEDINELIAPWLECNKLKLNEVKINVNIASSGNNSIKIYDTKEVK